MSEKQMAEKRQKEIMDYFHLSIEELFKQKGNLLLEMTLAVERDDLHRLHMLGYCLER